MFVLTVGHHGCARRWLCARRLLLLLLLLIRLRMSVAARRVCLTVGHHGCARRLLLLLCYWTANHVCLTVGHHGCARPLLLCYACRGTASHVCLTVGHHGCARPLGPPPRGRCVAAAMSLLVVDARCIVGAWHDKSTVVWGPP